MDRIAGHFGVADRQFFVLSNGIFTTGAGDPAQPGRFAKVQHIPVKGARLDKVIAVNQLSRDIEQQALSLDDVAQRLEQIRTLPAKPAWAQMVASAVGSACFCILFGGSIMDALAALIAGFVLWMFVYYISGPHMNKIVGNLVGGALVTMICVLCKRIGLGDSMNWMIIGSIIPLVPGVPFTNGIRDIGNGDYISGAVRLLDATLVFLCIAIGVGVSLSLLSGVMGGVAW